MGAAFMSCSKDIAFDSEAATQKVKAEYEANFVKKYGAIDPNQTWDLTSMQPTYSLTPEGNSARTITRGTETIEKTITPDFTVEGKVLTWFFTNLRAGDDNTTKGDPFYMTTVEGEPFTIVPIFQGNASKYWELYMHVDGIDNDILVWKKGDQLRYRMEEGGTLTPTGVGQAGVNEKAFEVKAPAISFAGLPQKHKVDFYLKAWTNWDTYTKDNLGNKSSKFSSLKGKMIALKDCEKPGDVPENVEACIIGCEDANGVDDDFEDLAFLVYGKFGINKPDEIFETTTKRYLIEDLGATDDFDFNDIVCDVSQTKKTTIYYTLDTASGKLVKTGQDGPTLISQDAVIRAAGGTIDFTITIGSKGTTKWTKSDYLDVETMYNTGWNGETINYNAELAKFPITDMDWDPETNNITVEVDGRGENQGLQIIEFAKEGTVPMMVAVDKTINWMNERQSVPGPKDPKPWWYEPQE